MKKYVLNYTSGATGFGWEEEHDTINQPQYYIDSKRNDRNAAVTLWDNELHDFVFWKDCLTAIPSIDLLHNYQRDLRTITKKRN